MLTRRQMLAGAGSVAWLSQSAARAQTSLPRMGGAPTAFSIRMRAARSGDKPFDIVEHCHGLGLSVIETSRPPTTPEAITSFRQKLEEYNMRVIFNVPLPRTREDNDAFDTGVKAAKDSGAIALHAALTPRRYEQFDSFDAFKKSFEQNQLSVSLAEPVLRKYRLRLAIENHKGWRAAEQAAWLKRVGSEYVGVCFDFGNNISLCETPGETFRQLSPLAIFCHIKDMAVERYADGFLLSEVPFGEGILNLKQMVQTLRQRDPNMVFCLEMITRDPLKIPVFTDKYWVTFDDSYSPLPARDLAKVLELVRDNPPKKPLPKIAGLSPAEQVKAEDDYNQQCVDYARKHLDL
jgi:sugar phosphate isomerase/epimerase